EREKDSASSHPSGSARPAPAAERHPCPDRLDEPERPGALQEAVGRAEAARRRKSQDEPAAALLESIAQQHQRHGEQSEERERREAQGPAQSAARAGIPCPRSRRARSSTRAKTARPRRRTAAATAKRMPKARATRARWSAGRARRVKSSRLAAAPVSGRAWTMRPSTRAERGARRMRPPKAGAKPTAPLTAPRSCRSTAFCAATVVQGKIGPMPKPAIIRMSEATGAETRSATSARTTTAATVKGSPV